MSTLVFLDLEETLINNWEDQMILPSIVERITNFIDELADSDTTLGLMSWALWNDKDLAKFKKKLQPLLEEFLGRPIRIMWTMDTWAEQLFLHSGKHLSRDDLFDCVGKHELLWMMACRHPMFSNKNVILFDDTAEHNASMHVPRTNCNVRFINVKQRNWN